MGPNLKFSFPPSSDPEVNTRGVSGESVDGGWTKLYHRPTTSPSSDMSSWLPRRPTSNASHPALITPSPKSKGKERSLGSVDSDLLSFSSRHGHNPDNLGFKFSDSSTSTTAHDSSHSAPMHSPSQHTSSFPSRHRASILSVASDALGLRRKIGSVSRKKQNFHSVAYTTDDMPGVIEINAHDDTTVTSTVGGTTAHKDDEHEERERLRDAAAQSIGLDPDLLHDLSKSESRTFLDSPQSPLQPVFLPPFPATLAALQPFTELSATLPKFTPPSSLLSYALSKQWKPRTIIFTSHSPSKKTHVHLFKSKDEREAERLEITEQSVIFVAEEEVGGRGNVVKLAGKDVSAKRSEPVNEPSLRTMWFLQIRDPTESQRWIAAIKNAVLTQRAVRAGLDIPARMNGGNEPKGDMDVILSMHLQGIIPTHATKLPSAVSPESSPVLASPSRPASLRSLRINIPSSPSPTNTVKGIFPGTRPRSPTVEGSPTFPRASGHTEDSFGAAGASLLTMLRTKSSTDSTSSPSHSLSLPLPHVQGRGSPAPSLRSANPPVVITASDLKISWERDAPESSTAISDAIPPSIPPSSNTPPTPSLSPQGTFTLSLQPPPRKCKHPFAPISSTSLQEHQGLYQQAGGNRSVAGNFGIPSRGSDDIASGETSPISLDSSSIIAGQPGSLSSSLGIGAAPGTGEVHVSEQSDDAIPTQLGNGTTDPSSPESGFALSDKLLKATSVTKRWSRQGIPLPKQLTPPIGPPPSIPPSPENKHRASVESSMSVSITYAVERPPSSSSSHSHSQTRISPSSSSLSPTFWRRASGSSAYSGNSASTSDSQSRSQIPVLLGSESSSLRPVVGNADGASSRPMSMSILGPLSLPHIGTSKRRSMPPPRPAPNFAPPPAPTMQEATSRPTSLQIPPSTPQKLFRTSVAQRALRRRSLTSPKPPPSSALPPRPDEVAFVPGHRRSSSAGTPDPHPVPVSSSCLIEVASGNATPTQQHALPPGRTLSIRQRLRILSTTPVQPPPPVMPSTQVSTLDMSDDNDDDDDLPTPYFQPCPPIGLGEHIITMQNDPSFLQLSSPVTPTLPKPPPRSPFRPLPSSSSSMEALSVLTPPEPDRDFVALSPPPRRGSKPMTGTVARAEVLEVDQPASTQVEEGNLASFSHSDSTVSLGFVTT